MKAAHPRNRLLEIEDEYQKVVRRPIVSHELAVMALLVVIGLMVIVGAYGFHFAYRQDQMSTNHVELRNAREQFLGVMIDGVVYRPGDPGFLTKRKLLDSGPFQVQYRER